MGAEERIRRFIDIYSDFLTEHPQFPRLAMQDIVSGGSVFPEALVKAQHETGLVGGGPILDMIRRGSAAGEIRPVDPKQTLVSIIGMTVFYFVAEPALDVILLNDAGERQAFFRARKASITDLVLHGLLPRKSSDTGTTLREE